MLTSYDREPRPAYQGSFIRGALMVVMAVMLPVVYAFSQFQGLREPLAMENAQVARNLVEGQGWVTHVQRPFDLWLMAERGVPLPEYDNALPSFWLDPAWPSLQALALRVIRPPWLPESSGARLMPAETRVIVPMGIVVTLLTAWALGWLGAVLWDARMAVLTVAAFLLTDLVLSASVSGLPDGLSALAVTLTWCMAVLTIRRSAQSPRFLATAACTFLCASFAALAVLTDIRMLVVALVAGVFLGTELQRYRWLLLVFFSLTLVAVVMLGWSFGERGGQIGWLGAYPYAFLRGTSLFPTDALERSVEPVMNAYRVAAAVRQGFAVRAMALISGEGLARGGVVMVFFLVSLFQRMDTREARFLKGMTFLMFLFLAVMPVVPGRGGMVSWMAVFPLVTLVAVRTFIDTIERQEFFDAAMIPMLTALLLLLCGLPAGVRLLQGAEPSYPPYHPPLQRFAAAVPEQGQVLLTDIPWATSWYGGGVSRLLPQHPEEVAAMPGGWLSVGALYLTHPQSASSESLWAMMLLGGHVPEVVPMEHGVFLPDGARDQLLLLRHAPASL